MPRTVPSGADSFPAGFLTLAPPAADAPAAAAPAAAAHAGRVQAPPLGLASRSGA